MRVRNLAMAAALVAVSGTAAVAVAVSSSATSRVPIERSGCIDDSGVTRVVADATQCAPTEAEVVWRG